MAGKVDLKKDLKALYLPLAKEVSFVDVPAMNFLMVDGAGDPNTAAAYREAIEALYAVAYGLKFALKKAGETPDFGVMPLEGLWWADDMADFLSGTKDRWKWTAMIMQPDFVTAGMVDDAARAAGAKKDLPALKKLRLERFAEGKAAQILYFGPFAEEGPTIARIHAAIAEKGRKLSGRHHEIYLSDPRRTEPAKLKTVIRQPYA